MYKMSEKFHLDIILHVPEVLKKISEKEVYTQKFELYQPYKLEYIDKSQNISMNLEKNDNVTLRTMSCPLNLKSYQIKINRINKQSQENQSQSIDIQQQSIRL